MSNLANQVLEHQIQLYLIKLRMHQQYLLILQLNKALNCQKFGLLRFLVL